MKLKATKTRLYNLVKHYYPDVPPLRRTNFTKVLRYRSLALRFDSPAGDHCEAYFSETIGKPFLRLCYPIKWIWLSLDELQRYDLIDVTEVRRPEFAP